jgi:hypothetical protein
MCRDIDKEFYSLWNISNNVLVSFDKGMPRQYLNDFKEKGIWEPCGRNREISLVLTSAIPRTNLGYFSFYPRIFLVLTSDISRTNLGYLIKAVSVVACLCS